MSLRGIPSGFVGTRSTLVALWLTLSGVAVIHLIGLGDAARMGYFGQDFRPLWRAGMLTWLGENPWLPNPRFDSFIAYPPQTIPLLAVYGIFEWPAARLAQTTVSALCLASLVLLAKRWFETEGGRVGMEGRATLPLTLTVLPLALVALDTLASNVLAIGQTSLIVAAASLWALEAARRQRFLLAGLLLAIASVKPQVSMAVALWFLFRGEWRVLIPAMVVGAIMLLPAFVIWGPVTSVTSFIHSLGAYKTLDGAPLGGPDITGIPSVFVALGWPGGEILGVLAGVAAFALLLQYRDRLSPLLISQALIALPLLALYGHAYDLAAIAILWGYLILLGLRVRTPLALALVAGVLLLYHVPSYWATRADLGAFSQWRTVAVLLSWLVACFLETALRAHSVAPKNGAADQSG